MHKPDKTTLKVICGCVFLATFGIGLVIGSNLRKVKENDIL